MMKEDLESVEKELVWEFFGRRQCGFFIEVGANHPTLLSQTYLLECHGWSGILVEPNPACCEDLRETRLGSTVVQAAVGSPEQVGQALLNIPEGPGHAFIETGLEWAAGPVVRTEKVTVTTLNDVLEKAANPRIDFLSIDVEGMEGHVLRGLDLGRHRPALILVEDHLTTLGVHFYLRRRRYRLVRRTGLNNWYVPCETRFRMAFVERFRLFRKLWLSHPFRRLRLALRRFRKPGHARRMPG